MNPSAIAAAATAAALALVSCPALAGPLEELAGGGTPDLVAAVAAIDPAAAPARGTAGTTPRDAASSTATPAAGGTGATSTSPAASAWWTAPPAQARPDTC